MVLGAAEMASLRGPLLPLRGGVALLLLLLEVDCSGSSSSHSMRYFHMGLSEAGQGLPQYIAVGYVDEQPFAKYDSITRRYVPQVPWVEKVGKEDPQYWETQTQIAQGNEAVFRGDLVTLRDRFHQKNGTGLHTLQFMVGCDVGPEGQLREGHFQYAYDGEDFLCLHKDTLTWTASVPQAEITKRELETQPYISQRYNSYLEETCVEWLRRYLGYGNESLLRTEAPVTRVTRKKGHDGQETLFCQLYGFYPKEIEVTWMKDGEDQKSEIFSGGVVPNSDGTYHTWLSIEVDPKERDRYRCRVGHDSLLEPLELAWEEPAPRVWLFPVIAVAILIVLILMMAGVLFYKRKRLEKVKQAIEDGCRPTPVKQPLEDGYRPIANSWSSNSSGESIESSDSSSSGGSGQISDSSSSGESIKSSDSSRSGFSDPGSESSKPLV